MPKPWLQEGEIDPGRCRERLPPHPFVSTGDGQRCRWVGGRGTRCGCLSVNPSLISTSNKQYSTTIIDKGLSRVLLYNIIYKCFCFNTGSQLTHPPSYRVPPETKGWGGQDELSEIRTGIHPYSQSRKGDESGLIPAFPTNWSIRPRFPSIGETTTGSSSSPTVVHRRPLSPLEYRLSLGATVIERGPRNLTHSNLESGLPSRRPRTAGPI